MSAWHTREMFDPIYFEEGVSVETHGVASIGTSLEWFEAQLDQRGIFAHPDSGLGRGLSALRLWREKSHHGRPERMPIATAVQECLASYGTDYLTKCLHRGHSHGLRAFDSHWPLLKAANPILTSPAGKSSIPRNKTWELMNASWAATFCTDVVASEPDTICTFAGKRIGLASKVLYGSRDDQFLDIIRKGARQIQQQDVDAGFVLLNMVEVFPHVQLFQHMYNAGVRSPKAAIELVAGWCNAFLVAHDLSAWQRHLEGMTKLVSVMAFIPTVLPLVGHPMPLPYYRLHTFEMIGREDIGTPFQHALQAAAEDIPGFAAP